MIRFAMFAAAIAVPCCAMAAEPDAAAVGATTVVQALTSASPSSPTINQTYDPANAFDGYWYPAQRAVDGQEDR
jgi:hypothetical protein